MKWGIDARGWRAHWLRHRPRVLRVAGIGFVALLSLVAGVSLGTWQAVCRDCPSIAQIFAWEPKQATKILDRNGELIAELFEERRTPIEIETLPAYVPQAFIAVEDKRFYQHAGLDYRRIVTANIQNVLSGRITGGGSTLTQQLARNMFEEGIGFEQRVTRKLKEFKVAKQIEEVYTKDQILEAYINLVGYGHGWRGIETAAQHYFGKAAIHLTPAEAAMLAAVVNAPGHYSPFTNPERALQRRNLVLGLMAQQAYLTRADAEHWRAEPLPESRHGVDVNRVAPYFVEWVRTTLDDRYGSRLYSGGLRVHTTLDMAMQGAAEAAMDSGWARIEQTPGFNGETYAAVMAGEERPESNETPYLQGMLISMDPHTGEIRALIGGRDYGDSKFNRATQALRQLGSTFKPFVYHAAIVSGIPASHIVYDAPLMIDLPDSTVYAPKNYSAAFAGPLTLRDALKNSINTIAVRLGMDVGLETVVQTARDFGIRTDVPAYPSTPIGAASVVPLQLAEAYSVFANNGDRVRARPILRVEDATGRVLWETEAERQRATDPLALAITRDLLRTAVDNGTGYPVRDPTQGNLPYEVPVGGKTGTTNDGTDVWFAGFTPNQVALVWFGFDRPRTITVNAAGGRLAAPVWGQYMRSLYYAEEPLLPLPEPWPMPEQLTTRHIDATTGRIANEWCTGDRVYTEYFLPGTEPQEACEPYRGGLFGVPIRPVLPDTTLADTLMADTTARDTLAERALRWDTVRPGVLYRDTLAAGAMLRDTLRGDRVRVQADTLMRTPGRAPRPLP